MMICNKCGKNIPYNSKFCNLCGEKVRIDKLNKEDIFGVKCCNIYNGSWINQYNDWIYVLKDGLWRMKEDGSEISKISLIKGEQSNSLNVNKHGIFYWVKQDRVVHLSHDGKLIGEIKLDNAYSNSGFFVYDNTIYFSFVDYYNNKVGIGKYKINNTENQVMTSFCQKENNSYIDHISQISANDMYITFYVNGDSYNCKNHGWHIINKLNGNMSKIKSEYIYRYEDGEISKESIDIKFIDTQKNLVYTSVNRKEEKVYGYKSNSIVVRKLRSDITKIDKNDKLLCNTDLFNGGKGLKFYSDRDNVCFSGERVIGFNYGHGDYYYNLYSVDTDGNTEYLNAGTRGGIEQLNIVGNYAYFDSDLVLRANLNGFGMDKMKEWLVE